MEKNLRDEESDSTQNSKLKPNKRRERNINHSNDVINESQFNADTGDQAVKCEVCGKAFMSYSELRAHCGIHTELPRHYLCEEEIPVNLEKDSSLDQEEPEPPQIKEEQVEVCTSHEEQQETDNPTVTLTYEESDRSEAEPTNVQLQDQSQDQEGSGRESTGNAELRPKKRRHSNDGDNSSMSESHRNTAKDLSQQYVCEEKEILTDQQFFNHESNSSLDQQEPEPPQFKEELEERCTSQEEEWLELKQETDILLVTPTHEESELTSDQLLSQNSSVAERQEMEKNLRDEESESTQNSKLKPHKRHGRSINHSNDEINESQFNADIGDQAVKCEVCGKAFMSYSELRAHYRMHTGEKPYSCEICKKAFRYYSPLLVHMRTHTGEKPYSCETCGKGFIQSGNLQQHMRIHTGEKSFSCSTCGKCFISSSHLTTHLKVHTGEKPYSCKTCGKCFSRSYGLLGHMRTHTGEKPFTCSTCGKAFRSNSNLTAHIKVHTGEKPYSCKICGKCFSWSDSLLCHMRTHTGEKPHVCKTCGKCFSERGNMLQHMRTHTGEKLKTKTLKRCSPETSHVGMGQQKRSDKLYITKQK
ncbi:uncharacterized protein LOC142382471 isoform X2 [Odontesthes bonariensis]|uniref:uncharacterized protein LOC142382471 isoform X2 n=1 Tax=Odontesthes bonariensis TaxID=219752 RepID=UPI003F58E85A